MNTTQNTEKKVTEGIESMVTKSTQSTNSCCLVRIAQLFCYLAIVLFSEHTALAGTDEMGIEDAEKEIRDYPDTYLTYKPKYHMFGTMGSILAHLQYNYEGKESFVCFIHHPCLRSHYTNSERKILKLHAPFMRDYRFFPDYHEELFDKSFFYAEMPYFVNKEENLVNGVSMSFEDDSWDSVDYKYDVVLSFAISSKPAVFSTSRLATFRPFIENKNIIYILTWIEKEEKNTVLLDNNTLYLYSPDEGKILEHPAVVFSDYLKLRTEDKKIVCAYQVSEKVQLYFELTLECTINSKDFVLGWKKITFPD